MQNWGFVNSVASDSINGEAFIRNQKVNFGNPKKICRLRSFQPADTLDSRSIVSRVENEPYSAQLGSPNLPRLDFSRLDRGYSTVAEKEYH